MKRYEAISIILDLLLKKDLAIFGPGMISREGFYLKDRPANFYMLGSLGLISAFALGVATVCRDKKIVILEGDGSAFLSLGGLAMVARSKLENIIHIVLDNGVYGSTGNQKCISAQIDLLRVAKALRYKNIHRVSDKDELQRCFLEIKKKKGPVFILVKLDTAEMKVPRVCFSPRQIKKRFSTAIKG